jgi:hypothetical protein
MTQERKLEDIALQHEMLAVSVDETLIEGWEAEEQAEFYGAALASAVMKGECSLVELKNYADEMNDLYREVMEKTGGDIENLDDLDYFEAIARRNGQSSAHYGYDLVKTRDRRIRLNAGV